MLCYVLCRTLQSPKLSAAEGNAIAHDVIKVLYKDKNEHSFKLFWDKVLLKKEKPEADDPKLSRKRRMPARLDHGDPSNNYFPSSLRKVIVIFTSMLLMQVSKVLEHDSIMQILNAI